MVHLLISSLLALVWTCASMATPLIAEPLSDRDLDTRQSSTSKCPSSYESKNGMNFTTYCEQNNPWNDALDPFSVSSMEECMERCSRYWGDGEGCFGIVWREDGQCWIRNSTTSTANLVNDTGIYSALTVRSNMTPLDEDCPYSDLSTHSFSDIEGIGYTVHCDKAIGGYDSCWDGYPSCLQSPFIGFYHATSLDSCLRICIDEHPLCRGVVYNPGLEIGFANCWPKTGFPNTLTAPASNQGVMHSATITSLDTIDTKCPEESTYAAASGTKNFEIHCGQLNAGTNITSLHTQNITACMDSCAAASAQKCVGVVFDSSLQGGYENCYLQNTTSVISDQASVTYALLTGTSIPSSGPSGSSSPGTGNGNGNSEGSSTSKAWIAGAVIGPIVGIALIAGAVLLFRRRKARAAGAGGTGTAVSIYGGEKDGNAYAPAPAYSQAVPPSELGGDYAVEMEHRPAVKYAHAQQGTTPQELPT